MQTAYCPRHCGIECYAKSCVKPISYHAWKTYKKLQCCCQLEQLNKMQCCSRWRKPRKTSRQANDEHPSMLLIQNINRLEATWYKRHGAAHCLLTIVLADGLAYRTTYLVTEINHQQWRQGTNLGDPTAYPCPAHHSILKDVCLV